MTQDNDEIERGYEAREDVEDEVELVQLLRAEVEEEHNDISTDKDVLSTDLDELLARYLTSENFDAIIHEEVDFILAEAPPMTVQAQSRMIQGASRAFSYRRLGNLPADAILEDLKRQLKSVPPRPRKDAEELETALSTVERRKRKHLLDVGADRVAGWIFALDIDEDRVLAVLKRVHTKGDVSSEARVDALLGEGDSEEFINFSKAVRARLRELRAKNESSSTNG